ncbi:Wrky transcription factor [Thalictrum thalictroides]|uniref:Wrky transcription factor n=1 Tax=Thalictrum thalictroides TaxID=46969 RepID=A0A7J6VQ34_THATH|nr:Wrky transcription factor [Thalictrum thalictroides]
MDGRFSNSCTNTNNKNQEDSENTSDNSGEELLPSSSSFGMISDSKITSTSSQKRSRRAIQKRVVSVPIADVEGSRIKGDGAPPYDSWAWRKYGQKPIKGSPYPRGYYRCSSSKGCPARKQVERSRVDPTMMVITYACDHNHSGAPSRIPSSTTTTTAKVSITPKSEPEIEEQEPQQEEISAAIFTTTTQTESEEDKFTDLVIRGTGGEDDFVWFSDVASTSDNALLESPIYSGNSNSNKDDGDMAATAMIFPMGEEDESLFADLGELPECSVVFQRGLFLDHERRRRCTLRAG